MTKLIWKKMLKWMIWCMGLNHFCRTSPTCLHLHVCLCSPAPLSLFSFLQGSLLAKSALRSLSPSAFNPWLETAGVTLAGGRVKSGEPCLIQRGGSRQDCGQRLFVFFSRPITYEHLHINDSPVAVKEERRWAWRDKRQMKMKCHERKVQARRGEIELFYLLVRSG